jgi:hypothetical protein
MAHKTAHNPFSMPFSARIRDMAHLPFSVFERAGRRFYSVSFKNEAGAYLPALSTKQETEAEAIQTAFQWLRDGIPRKGEAVHFKKYTLRDMAKEAGIGKADAVFILKESDTPGKAGGMICEPLKAVCSGSA